MKRALALMGAMMALCVVGVSSASAACVAPYCPAPSASATGATNVGTGTATVNATVNTNGGNAASWSISLSGFGTVASGSIPDGTSPVPVSANVSSLTAGVTYTYTVTVTNSGGSASSSTSFTTQSLPPVSTPPVPPSEPSTPPVTPSEPSVTPPTTSEPSTAPTTPPPPATNAEKREASSTLSDSVRSGDVTYEAQVGSALVFSVDDSKPSVTGRVQVLAMTADPGAEVATRGSVKLDNGKTIRLPKATTTVGPDGQVVVTIKLNAKQRAQLAKAGGGTVSLQVQVTDQYGTHTKTVKVDIEPNKPKKAKSKNGKKNG